MRCMTWYPLFHQKTKAQRVMKDVGIDMGTLEGVGVAQEVARGGESKSGR